MIFINDCAKTIPPVCWCPHHWGMWIWEPKTENMAFVSRVDTFHAHDKMFVTQFGKYGEKSTKIHI